MEDSNEHPSRSNDSSGGGSNRPEPLRDLALKEKRLTGRKAGRRTLIPYNQLEAYLASLPAYEGGA